MAKLVLAGKTDCPLYAKAELLADSLQRSLPDFKIHKISILPDEWKGWLEATCQRNGWKHDESPLVWRELVTQGGRGMLLGGLSNFLEHCQDYYNITSDMPTDEMLSIAAENLETKLIVMEEEQQRLSLIKPHHVWISSALSPACVLLIPNLLSADVFPHVSVVGLHLLDLDGTREELQQLKMETEDLALHLLHQVTIHTDVEEAFQEADVILLLDECCRDDTESEDEEDRRRKQMKVMSDRYREFGRLIDTRAHREVRVIVAGDSSVNLRCSLLLDNVRSIDSRQFVAMATQLEDEARAIIAKKLKVKTSGGKYVAESFSDECGAALQGHRVIAACPSAPDVTDVTVWGNISGSFYVDLQRAKVFNYDGAIRGPAFFSQPVQNLLPDRKWLETDFQELVRRQRAAVASKTCRAAAMSLANGILTVLRAWNGTCGPDEFSSMGVLCPGCYDLPDGIVVSVPVTFTDGKWSVILDVTVGEELKTKLQLFAKELSQEKERGSLNC